MRGDTLQDEEYVRREGIDSYIHPHYDDIEAVYRNQMFSLGL
jgi:hypothetical protein